jgi:cobalt-zinc-cadmium efflux system protein
VTLHAHLKDGADSHAALSGIQERLGTRFGIGHATVQIERGECAGACHDAQHH